MSPWRYPLGEWSAGPNCGFGLAHIESYEGRVAQFAAFGFRNVVSYVRHVASSYTHIILQEDGRLVFQCEHGGYFHQIVTQWDEELGFWSITTAIPKRAVRGANIVWKK